MITIEAFLRLSPVIQALFATLFTYFVTMLGAAGVFLFKNFNQKILDLMMGVSSGIMIAASFWSLLNPAIALLEELNKSYFDSALGFVLGGLCIIISESMLSKNKQVTEHKKRAVLITSAITLHNIPEGMAVGVAFGSVAIGAPNATIFSAIALAIGIGIQNFPEGLCVALPLRKNGASRMKSFLVGQASGIVEPLAGLLGVLFSLHIKNIMPFMLCFSAGAMIAVVASELIPESFHNNKSLASLGLLFGFTLMMILDLVF